jgi:aminobutyraldehyde dehydrogenase
VRDVLKPSEQTPLTALKLAVALRDILPKGVVNVISGRGDETVGVPLPQGCAPSTAVARS